MGNIHHPTRGSHGYSPRVRAKRIYPRVQTKITTKEAKILDFGGYKVGMAQVAMIHDQHGPLKGQPVTTPATIIEVPPLKIVGIRAYAKDSYGNLRTLTEMWTNEVDKNLERKANVPKKTRNVPNFEKLQGVAKYSLMVHSQPSKSGLGKKKPELFEADIGGSVEEQLKFAKEKLGKEITIKDVFSEGQYVDVIGITKGHGFQGSIKRWGLKLLKKKSQKLIRKAATLGPWHPRKVLPTVPQMGQMGFHKRTELNKRVLRISDDSNTIKDINANGWKGYGIVRSTFILLKGSVQGPTKRFIRLRTAVRPSQKAGPATVEAIMR